jgi:N-acetylneuraminic acid mutarotase
VYVFDPATNAWSEKKPMPAPSHHIMTAVLNDKVYVFGGFVAAPSSGQTGAEATSWVPTDRSWLYDPALDQWKELKRMPTPRGAGWAVSRDNKIYVIGGAQSGDHSNPKAALKRGEPQRVLGTVEVYDPTTDRWSNCSPMPTARNHFVAAAVNGRIYAIGGRLGSAMITSADDTDVVEEYDPTTDRWTGRGRSPVRWSGMTGGEYKGKIYIAGGEFQDWEGAKAIWAVQTFDPADGQWENLPRMQLAHHGFAGGFLGNTFHIAGGGFQSDGMPGVNTKTAVHEVLQLDQ